jgi:hypothetical protein
MKNQSQLELNSTHTLNRGYRPALGFGHKALLFVGEVLQHKQEVFFGQYKHFQKVFCAHRESAFGASEQSDFTEELAHTHCGAHHSGAGLVVAAARHGTASGEAQRNVNTTTPHNRGW